VGGLLGQVARVVDGQVREEPGVPACEIGLADDGGNAAADSACRDHSAVGGQDADRIGMRGLDPRRAFDGAGQVEIDNGGVATGGLEEPASAQPCRVPHVRGEVDLMAFLVAGTLTEAVRVSFPEYSNTTVGHGTAAGGMAVKTGGAG